MGRSHMKNEWNKIAWISSVRLKKEVYNSQESNENLKPKLAEMPNLWTKDDVKGFILGLTLCPKLSLFRIN